MRRIARCFSKRRFTKPSTVGNAFCRRATTPPQQAADRYWRRWEKRKNARFERDHEKNPVTFYKSLEFFFVGAREFFVDWKRRSSKGPGGGARQAGGQGPTLQRQAVSDPSEKQPRKQAPLYRAVSRFPKKELRQNGPKTPTSQSQARPYNLITIGAPPPSPCLSTFPAQTPSRDRKFGDRDMDQALLKQCRSTLKAGPSDNACGIAAGGGPQANVARPRYAPSSILTSPGGGKGKRRNAMTSRQKKTRRTNRG